MKKTRGILLILIASLLMLSGCAGHKPMSPIKMYSAPNFSEMMPETITAVTLKLNQNLDVSDTAFYPNYDIKPSTSWPFFRLPSGETDMSKAREFLAVRMDSRSAPNTLVMCFSEKLTAVEKDYGFLGDHAIEHLYNSKGQMIYAPNWQDKEIDDFSGFVEQIGDMNIIEVHRGEKAYDNLLVIFEPFVHEQEEAWSMGIKIRDDRYREVGIPIASILSKQQTKLVMSDEEFKAKLISFLGENWYGVITFPLWTPEQYGVSMLITKVFQIPTKFWSMDMDRPGFMGRKLIAQQGGVMIDYYDKTYGFKSMFSPEDVAVLQELVRQLQERK